MPRGGQVSARLVIDVIGPPRIAAAELTLSTRKALARVAVLAVSGPTTRARLADLLWGEQRTDDARRNLRQELHRLCTTEIGPRILARGDVVQLSDGAEIDARRFRAAAAADDPARTVHGATWVRAS